jgi:MFS superfamily sulfate permease-like transporter
MKSPLHDDSRARSADFPGASSMNQARMATKEGAPETQGLRLDVVAGLVAAAVVLPKAMAYATVVGLQVAVGLYTAFIPMLV